MKMRFALVVVVAGLAACARSPVASDAAGGNRGAGMRGNTAGGGFIGSGHRAGTAEATPVFIGSGHRSGDAVGQDSTATGDGRGVFIGAGY